MMSSMEFAVSFSRRQGYAASGFAYQLENAFKRAQEAPIQVKVHALSTADNVIASRGKTSMSKSDARSSIQAA